MALVGVLHGKAKLAYMLNIAITSMSKGAMSDFLREQRLQIMVTEEELQAIDDWRFARRMPTRAAAVRELLKRGLIADGFNSAAAGEKSQDFGVLSPPEPPRIAQIHPRQSGDSNP